MPTRPLDAADRRERRRFVSLEADLLGGQPLFVPEIASDLQKRLRGRSPFYEEMEYAPFLAGNGRDVARCVAFVNRRWQRDRQDRAGFIGYFAAAPDAEAESREMLGTAERWLADHGADRAIAPFNGATFHGIGVQTDAYDEEPMFPFPWQPPHYARLLEAAGYRPTYPLWTFEVDFSSERYRATSDAALANARCEVRPLDKKRWDAEVETLRAVFNDTFRDEWEFHAMTGPEFHELLDQIKPVLDPRQFLFAEVDGETAGFCFGFPDWTPLFRSFKGRAGPLQILKMLLRAKRFDRAGLIAIGVRDSHRGRRIGHTLAATLYRHYAGLGLPGAFYYPVNDHNLASLRFAESFGASGRILHHVYDKPLGGAAG